MNILEQIRHVVMNCPERLAFINREKSLTYEELWDKSDALASWLLQQDASHTPVIVYGHKEPEMLICFLACVKAGHAYIPIDVSTPADRVEQIIRNSNTKSVLSTVQLPINFSSDSAVLAGVSLQQAIEQYHGKSVTQQQWITGDDNFYIIYTSGSTGAPKGVQITSNCLCSFLSWMTRDFGLNQQSVFLNQAPFAFDLSVMDLYTSLVTGGTVWAVDKEMIAKPMELFAGFKTADLNVWVSTPSFAELCLTDPSFNESLLPSLHSFLFCGETLSNRCAETLIHRFPGAKLFNTYGPTEATVAVTSIEVTREVMSLYSPLPVGYCKPDCRIRIMDEAGTILPDGQKGEIVILGPSVSPGYYQDPTLTQRSFYMMEDKELGYIKAYRTGDMGFVKDGLLFYEGRMDFQIKLQGYRIELGDIEENLRRLPMVNTVAVIPVMKNDKCQYLTAFIVPDSFPVDHEFSLSTTIRQQLREVLPQYMIPRRFVFRERFPMTSNGKIDRKQLVSEVE